MKKMRHVKKLYMFRYRHNENFDWIESKIYTRAYQCQKQAEELQRFKKVEIEFFEADIGEFRQVAQVYNVNTVGQKAEGE